MRESAPLGAALTASVEEATPEDEEEEEEEGEDEEEGTLLYLGTVAICLYRNFLSALYVWLSQPLFVGLFLCSLPVVAVSVP